MSALALHALRALEWSHEHGACPSCRACRRCDEMDGRTLLARAAAWQEVVNAIVEP